MTVNELISKLKQFDGDTIVVVDGYEGGVTEKFHISKVNIEKNVYKEWWYGESEIEQDGNIEAVYIQREFLHRHRDN